MAKIFYVIPAYNEEENLPDLIASIRVACRKSDHECEIIAVNDGSIDGTEEAILTAQKDFPVTYLKNEPNQGLGRTLRSGLKKAVETGLDEDMVVTMDADNTQDPAYVNDLVEALNKGFDIAVASRFVGEGGERGLSAFRKILSQGAGILLRVFFSRQIRDYTCGFRAYRIAILRAGFQRYGDEMIAERGFAASPEILIKLLHLNAKVTEVPFLLKYDLKKGESKINVPATILAYIKMVWRFKTRGY